MKFGILIAVSSALAAQVGHFANAQLQTRSAAQGLNREFRSLAGAGPGWIGYEVPAVREHQVNCDYSQGVQAPGPVHLEPPERVRVLYRFEQGRVSKIRTLSPDCEIDAGGLPVHWLTDVQPAESVALLATFASQRDRVGDAAVAALALHAGDAADEALEKLSAPDQPESLRRKAVFWLGAARGRRGYENLRRIVTQDPDDRVRERAIFGLSVSRQPEALDTMIATARNDKSAHVRSQALFWLAHKAGQKAIAAISEAVEKDPETAVQRRAVFALSQLPRDEGVPLLIETARNHRNPVVRKQAMFWLGQSNDPRALAFFEEILKK